MNLEVTFNWQSGRHSDDKIGHEFAREHKKFRSDVVLMKGHGVFAASDTLESCFKHVISVGR